MPTLESQPEWVKSSLSFANGNCVEVANLSGGEVGVRNSRDAAGAVLRFTPDEWHAFIGGVRNGEFDRFGALPAGAIERAGPRLSGDPPSRLPGRFAQRNAPGEASTAATSWPAACGNAGYPVARSRARQAGAGPRPPRRPRT